MKAINLSTESNYMTILDSISKEIYSVLFINLKNIQDNYLYLKTLTVSEVAAVVKANAYGLGEIEVSKALYEVGCRNFFVTHINEGIKLRNIMVDANIFVLKGNLSGSENFFSIHNLIPVINSYEQLENWNNYCKTTSLPPSCAIQFDSGMHRNGMDEEDVRKLMNNIEILSELNVAYYISHLASSENKEDEFNNIQLKNFRNILNKLPERKICFSNTGGIYLGKKFHFDMVRPGIGLWGYFNDNNLKPSVNLFAKVNQIHKVKAGESVGYNQTFKVQKNSKLATIAIGYGDGFPRSLSNKGTVVINNIKLPILGRVSMDSIVVDISSNKVSNIKEGDWVEIIGENNTIFDLANEANTIPYEILTSLGERYHRIYIS
ncbi:MAG: alanine racemase [Sphingobacteriia bacterium]|nr:alanine racemase [Sphingobacteriia bacterium]